MKLADYIGSILLTKDQYLSVTASPETTIDDAQVAVQNAHTETLLPCIRDRYSANTLLFDTRNHITLRQYLESAQFVTETFRLLLLQLLESVDTLAACGLPQANLLLGLDELYIDVVNKRMKLVYLPFKTSVSIQETMDTLSGTIREMLSIANVPGGHMLFGLLLSHINAERLDVVKLYADLRDYELITVKRSPRAISRVMLSYLFTMLLMAACVIGVPLWGELSGEYAVTQFIDLSTIAFVALLFLAGAILSCLSSLLLRETRRRKKRASAMPDAPKAPKGGKKAKAAPAGQPAQPVKPARTDAQNPSQPAARDPGPAAPSAQSAWLEDPQGARAYLDAPECAVGRDGQRARLVLEEIGVSGLHATVFKTQDGWMLRDEGSRNGTLLGGERLQPGAAVPLADGDRITFADVQRVFHAG